MSFITDSFMLKSDTAKLLYQDYAKDMPIFDYHCHLSAAEIEQNKQFQSITELWLGGDHYKWRLMRANGVPEEYITGEADPFEKFEKYAETLSRCIGNPLYHWSHLELKRYFGIDTILSKDTAREIYDRCNELLATDDFRAKALILRYGVAALCTTDDPADDLKSHIALAEDPTFPVQVLPTFRPDKAIHIENDGFADYVDKLGKAAGVSITDLDSMKSALQKRLEFFKAHGCLLSDHAFGAPAFVVGSKIQSEEIFQKALRGEMLTDYEVNCYHTCMMLFLGAAYEDFGIAMQLHMGAARNLNTPMYRLLGPDTGYDAIGNNLSVESVMLLLNLLGSQNQLPKTVLYSLNPNDNDKLAVAAGCFQEAPLAGKVQFGAAWWFNDHRDGMEAQMKALANTGVLGNFIGMLTDSRSFISYPRHEYFRRILCNMIAQWITDGELPFDFDAIGGLIRDICFDNAARYFGLPAVKTI